MKKTLYYVIIGLSIIIHQPIFGKPAPDKDTFDQNVIDKAKKKVVTIHVKISLSAYQRYNKMWSGTGFIINRGKGIILTNAHIVGTGVIGHYNVTFYNGKKLMLS